MLAAIDSPADDDARVNFEESLQPQFWQPRNAAVESRGGVQSNLLI